MFFLCSDSTQNLRGSGDGCGQLIEEVIGREGGYSNHSADTGGPTPWGVTEAVARAHGFAGDMRSFLREEAVAVYRRLYWLRPGFDRVAEHAQRWPRNCPTPALTWDRRSRLASSSARSTRSIATRATTPTSRSIGDATIAALAAFIARSGPAGEGVLLKVLEALQGERYLRLAEQRPANEAFLYGWLANRLG